MTLAADAERRRARCRFRRIYGAMPQKRCALGFGGALSGGTIYQESYKLPRCHFDRMTLLHTHLEFRRVPDCTRGIELADKGRAGRMMTIRLIATGERERRVATAA